jgi:hypothetical protein
MDNVEALLNAATTAVNVARKAEERVESLRQMTLFNNGRNAGSDDDDDDDGRSHTTYGSTLNHTSNPHPSWVDRIFDGLIPFVGKALSLLMWSTILLLTAAGIYAFFYFLMMPSLVVQEDVYFDYMHTLSGGGNLVHDVANRQIKIDPSFESWSPTCDSNNTVDGGKNSSDGSSRRSSQKDRSCKAQKFEQSSTKQKPIDEEPEMDLYTSGPDRLLSPWPIAWVDLYAAHSQWEAFTEDVAPEQVIHGRVLHAPSRYWMEVNLILPESVSNVNLGMFMMHMELFDQSKQLLARSKRPVLFPYSSGFIRHVRKVFALVPLALGAIPEARTVTVPCIDQYVESKERPLQYIRIALLLPSSHQSGGAFPKHAGQEQIGLFGYNNLRQVQVFGAQLHIGKELSRLQYFMKFWFFTSTAVGVFTLFALQLLIIFLAKLCWNNREKQEPLFFQDGAASLAFTSSVQGSLRDFSSPSGHAHRPSYRRRRKSQLQQVTRRRGSKSRRGRSKAVIPDDAFSVTSIQQLHDDRQQQALEREADDVIDFDGAISFGSSPVNGEDGDEFWEDIDENSRGAITVSSTKSGGRIYVSVNAAANQSEPPSID